MLAFHHHPILGTVFPLHLGTDGGIFHFEVHHGTCVLVVLQDAQHRLVAPHRGTVSFFFLGFLMHLGCGNLSLVERGSNLRGFFTGNCCQKNLPHNGGRFWVYHHVVLIRRIFPVAVGATSDVFSLGHFQVHSGFHLLRKVLAVPLIDQVAESYFNPRSLSHIFLAVKMVVHSDEPHPQKRKDVL